MHIEVMAFWRGRKGKKWNRKGREEEKRGEGARRQGMKRECLSLGRLSERGTRFVSVCEGEKERGREVDTTRWQQR